MKDGQQGKNTTFAILLTAGAICVCVISVCFGFALGKNGFGLAVETAGTQEAAAGTGETEESTREAEPQRMLWVSGVNAPESFSSFDPEELGGNLADTLYYKEVEDVKIRIGTEWMDFPEAIREGKVTSAELFYQARTDARNGFCQEKANSNHGLSAFVYTYPGELDLFFSYDVYETPDGQQHLVDDVWVGRANTMDHYTNRGKLDRETGLRLDREDWGLSFRVIEATPNGMTLEVIQSGGQQVGDLTVEACFLPDAAGGYVETAQSGMSISRNGATELTLDWSETRGALPAGDYILELQIWDIYDQCHPLIVKYNEFQEYAVSFTVS